MADGQGEREREERMHDLLPWELVNFSRFTFFPSHFKKQYQPCTGSACMPLTEPA